MVIYREKDFRPFMPDVEKYNHGLIELNNQWESVKLLCEINCPEQSQNIMPNMVNIQSNFSSLQNELIDSLVSETLNKIYQKARSKAQAAVDILIRNLYERTADVGFLATDDDICSFVFNSSRSTQDCRNITSRLKEYQKKYTIYEDIILLDNNFTVLANLDERNPILGLKIDDPFLKESLDSTKAFLEYFGPSPLQAKEPKAHIFSKRIIDARTNESCGILCLCFRFKNEMKGIFRKLCADSDGSVISIIDEDDLVIASSDETHVALGIKAEPVLTNQNSIIYYRGLEYIAKTVSTNGYQGYYGLGWKGHIMLPLNLAFKDKAAETLNLINADIMSGLMSQANSFSVQLFNIMNETTKINHSLKRIIYNGQIIADRKNADYEYTRLRPILNTIKKTGTEICKIFEKSVKNLFATVISSGLREESFLAANCIDVMDRNLYERSDDCRWWALNPTFKTILSKETVSGEDARTLTRILKYINSLYTVYTVLFLYDRSGKIIAVSNPEHDDKIGLALDDDYVREVLGNTSGDKYFVSPFSKSKLYNESCTYIYSASVTDGINKKTVGGIGIVFDSDFQFKSMLEESISSRENIFAVYAERGGRVISSTNEKLATGTTLGLPKRFFEIANGVSNSEIIVYDGAYYAVGYACSSGYREYKNSDGYKNDVIALVLERLAQQADTEESDSADNFLEQSEISVSGNSRTFGTFIADGHLFGLDKSVIVESVERANITRIPKSNEAVVGIVEYHGQFIAVLDMNNYCRQKAEISDDYNLLIVKLNDGIMVALMVQELVNVIEVGEKAILPAPAIKGFTSFIKNVVAFSGKRSKILLIIDEQKLFDYLDPEAKRLDIDQIVSDIQQSTGEKL